MSATGGALGPPQFQAGAIDPDYVGDGRRLDTGGKILSDARNDSSQCNVAGCGSWNRADCGASPGLHASMQAAEAGSIEPLAVLGGIGGVVP
eukprot:2953217-Amphidinium_carterae.1